MQQKGDAMMHWLADPLVDRPEIAIIVAMGAGFWIGRFQVKGIGRC